MACKHLPFAQTLLEVDLTNREINLQQIGERDIELFLGGRGVAAYLLRQSLASSDAPMIFSTALSLARMFQ